MTTHHSSGLNLGIGSVAFFAGILATIVTAFAMVSRKNKVVQRLQDHYDGWDEGLGV